MTAAEPPRTRVDPGPDATDAAAAGPTRRRQVTDRQKVIVAAVTLVSVIVLSTLVFALNSSYFKPEPGTQAANEVAAGNHPALDQPYSGHTPTSPGDRGGWEQLATLGLIVVAIGGGTTAVVLSGRKARRENAARRG
jgi:hypothetical protein